jgi:ribosomal protein S18 acetylase RimI-like enzyme
MTDEQIASFISLDMEQYAEERVNAGESPEEASKVVETEVAALFPDGSPPPGHLFYQVIGDDGTAVGSLWIGPPMGEEPGAKFWVWKVAVDELHRGRGLGRAAMLLAEEAARSHGATELGLSVFGHNVVARRLYESIGYITKSVQMRKSL